MNNEVDRSLDQIINKKFYDDLGENWYTADDDPVALLRLQSKAIGAWVLEDLKAMPSKDLKILDVGCGAGFLTNFLAKNGYTVDGFDLSHESLCVAKAHDETKSVTYIQGDAYNINLPPESYDVVTCMDFLEHVTDVNKVISEISKVLKPGGLLFFHTFNRNPLAGLLVIKAPELFLPKTPDHLHLYKMFIKPKELKNILHTNNFRDLNWRGLSPKFFSQSFFKSILKRRVMPDFTFQFSKSLLISYVGKAQKK